MPVERGVADRGTVVSSREGDPDPSALSAAYIGCDGGAGNVRKAESEGGHACLPEAAIKLLH